MEKQKKQIKIKKAAEVLLLLPVIFALAFIPMIMRVKDYDPKLNQYTWFPNVMGRLDAFLFYKSFALTILFALLVFYTMYLYLKHRLQWEWLFLPLVLYAVMILISAFGTISEYHTWNGFMDMFESAFVLFAYCLICYFSYAVIRSERQIKIVFTFLFISFGTLGVIGISQFVGHDIFAIKAVRNLIFPANLTTFQNTFGANLGDGIVYLTFFNQNYVGVYSCIMIPLLLVLTFTAGKKRFLPCYALAAILILVSLVGSESKTAVITLIPCMLFTVFYFGKKNWKRLLPVLAFYLLVFTGLNAMQKSSVFDNAMDRLMAAPTQYQEYALQGMTLNDDDYTITYKNRNISVKYTDEQGSLLPVVKDENGKVLKLKEETEGGVNTFSIADNAFTDLEFVQDTDADGNSGFAVTSAGYSFFIFYSEKEQTYLYTNYYGKHTKIYAAETCDLSLFHLMGGFSGRGYIWSKTLPILKRTLLTGTGPDTYAIAFPQQDYISLVQNGYESIMITKPHSMYLQIAVQTGVVSLILLLIFYTGYMVQSFRLYRGRKLSAWSERVGAGIFLSTIGFLISSLANDSTVGVSVIFWTLLGIGFACNRMVKKSITQI